MSSTQLDNGNNDLGVTFDEFSKIRILSSEQYEASEHLKDECRDFTQKISDFNTIVQMFLDLLQEKKTQIEIEKLKAIGLRNKVEFEIESRKARQNQMKVQIKERQAVLDRLNAQAESLLNVQMEQQRMIESLSSK
ncbi:Intraflagellar transport protein 20 [Chytridiales sp. JEL 0842]|nr:Intraflagellar transport protein 20 [Chytridiales sp. JEL 0842]